MRKEREIAENTIPKSNCITSLDKQTTAHLKQNPYLKTWPQVSGKSSKPRLKQKEILPGNLVEIKTKRTRQGAGEDGTVGRNLDGIDKRTSIEYYKSCGVKREHFSSKIDFPKLDSRTDYMAMRTELEKCAHHG